MPSAGGIGQAAPPSIPLSPTIRWKYPDSKKNEMAPLLGPLYFQFNTLMKAETVTSPGTVLLFRAPGGPVEIEVKQYPGKNAMNYMVVPKTPLEPGATYRLIVRKGPESVAGKFLESEISWTFSSYPLYYSCREGGIESNPLSAECLGRHASICYGEAGAGGGPNTLMCPLGFAVSRIEVGNNSKKGPYITSLNLYCSKWKAEGILPWVDTEDFTSRAVSEETGRPGAGNIFYKPGMFEFSKTEISYGDSSCPEGSEIGGIWGGNTSPGRLKKVGLKCRPFGVRNNDADNYLELVGLGDSSFTSEYKAHLPPTYNMLGARVYAGENIDGLDCVIGAKYH